MVHSSKIVAVVFVLACGFIAGCGRQPAQDYAITGTLRLDPRVGVDLDAFYENMGTTELVMTARTSPDVGDIVIQRRWMNVKLPHEFAF